MTVNIKCPKCGTEGSLSLADKRYEGPYRCWKCRELYNITIEKDKLCACQPMTQQEFEEQQEIQALKRKFEKKE